MRWFRDLAINSKLRMIIVSISASTVAEAVAMARARKLRGLQAKPIKMIPSTGTSIKPTSAAGVSVVKVETDYRLSLAEIERVWSELRDVVRTEAARFPEGVQTPVFDDDIVRLFK